jgi:hypothetical protein
MAPKDDAIEHLVTLIINKTIYNVQKRKIWILIINNIMKLYSISLSHDDEYPPFLGGI